MFRFIVSSILTGAVLATPVHADPPATNRDAELLSALRYIANADGGWTRKDWEDFAITVGKWTAITVATAGTGAALYYVKEPRGFVSKSILPSVAVLDKARKFIADHGGKVVVGVAAPIVITHVINQLAALSSITEAERLRNASTPDARVYRSHLRQYFKLSLSEQFMIARQDEKFIDDLIHLAAEIRAERLARRLRLEARQREMAERQAAAADGAPKS